MIQIFQISNFRFRDRKHGYVALLTVIILSAVATVIATSLLLLGLGHSRSALSENQTTQAKAAADGCTEEALRQIRLSSSYTASNVAINFTGSSCTYTVVAGTTGSITATGTSGNNIRKVTIDLSARTPNIVFTKWQETP